MRTTEWHAVALDEMIDINSPQRQVLTPGIAHGAQISVGYVAMPAGHYAAPHLHEKYDMTITVLEGHVMTMLGEDLEEVIMHKPGDALLIPAGIPHLGINLSTSRRVVLLETRADPHFNKDIQILPKFEAKVAEAAKYYQERFIEPTDAKNILQVL